MALQEIMAKKKKKKKKSKTANLLVGKAPSKNNFLKDFESRVMRQSN